MLAARWPSAAAARARQRKYPQAQQHGRTSSEATWALAAGVLVAPTLTADWSLRAVLRLYQARWQVELVLQRMQPRLRFNQLRSPHRTTVEATGRPLLIAWALQDGIVAERRARLPTAQQDTLPVVSTWSLVGWGLETLRHHVPPRWSQARRRACRPRFRRLLCRRPRRREPQATAVRAW
jgi:hypothetical protein